MVGKPLNIFYFCDILPFLIVYKAIKFLLLVAFFLSLLANTRTGRVGGNLSALRQIVFRPPHRTVLALFTHTALLAIIYRI